MMNIDIKQLGFVDQQMRKLIAWLKKETGFSFTITSLYRPQTPDSVHGMIPLRGVDLRCRNFSVGHAVEELINKHWLYDHTRPEKKCCILHGRGSDLHLHLQVHPNTDMRF